MTMFTIRWRDRGITVELPRILMRYTSRAWQGWPPAGYHLATDWTGREREFIGISPPRVTIWREVAEPVGMLEPEPASPWLTDDIAELRQ